MFNEILKSIALQANDIPSEIEYDDQGNGRIKVKTTVKAPRVFSGTADEFSQLPPEQQDKFNQMQEHIDNFNIRNRNIPGEEGEFERLQDETMPAFAQIKTELTPPADPANAVGAASGALTATLGTPGDVVGLASGAIYGIYKLAFPNEDETRLQSAASGFANVLGTVSETAGSMYTRSVFDGWLDKMPLDEETKAKIGEGADLGEWFGVPGAGTAVALGKKGIMKGAQKLGDFVTNAPDRIAAREADTAVQLNAGVDVPAAVDQAIVGVQKAFKKPTKDNPVTAVAPTETEPGIIAFHGSGADFDEFKLEKIGTGIGYQNYGNGLYFSNSIKVAESYKKEPGKVFMVKLGVKEKNLLDWQKPLKEQPVMLNKIRSLIDDEDILQTFDYNVNAGIAAGNAYVNYISSSSQGASELLKSVGIQGIKYLDIGSRAGGKSISDAPTNYVIFNDKAIKILDKYGIVGPVAITGVAASQQGEAETSEAM